MVGDFTSRITAWYQSVQYREAPISDLTAYTSALNSGEMTAAQVQSAILGDVYTSTYVNSVIREYLAAFGRVPDALGGAYWTGAIASGAESLGSLSAAFANSAEFQSRFGATATTIATSALVSSLYVQVYGRAPDAAGLAYWAGSGLNAAQLLNAFANADEFVTSTVASIAAYQAAEIQAAEIAGDPPVPGTLSDVVPPPSTAGGTSSSHSDVRPTPTSTPATYAGVTYTLKEGVDNLFGGSGNDTFIATNTPSSHVLDSGDLIDGGRGSDSLTIDDTTAEAAASFSLPVNFTIRNIETLKVATSGAFGSGNSPFDISSINVLSAFVGEANGSADSFLKAGSATNVALTVHEDASATVAGGKAVTVAADRGLITVQGAALTSVSARTGGSVHIDNQDTTGHSGAGTTLTEVSISNHSNADVYGTAVSTFTLSGQGADGSADTVTVYNSTANHVDTITLNGTGYSSNGTIASTIFVDPVATQAAITTTQRSSLDLTQSTLLKALTLTGAGPLRLAAPSAVTSIDGSAATGDLWIALAGAATVSTGAGNDTIIAASGGGTFTGGAGNDTFDVSATSVMVTITDFSSDDAIIFDGTSTYFAPTKVDVGATGSLDAALARASSNTTGGQINWFQYGGATYLVENANGAAGIQSGDTVVKLSGSVDLSGMSLAPSHALSNKTTEVVLSSDISAQVAGAALTTVTLSGQGRAGTARTITVTNSTANHADAITLNGTGYSSNGTSASTVFIDPTATRAAITTTQRSSLDLTRSTSLTSLTLTGAGALRVAAPGSVTGINGSAAAGDLWIALAGAATVSTGAGNDTIIAASGGGTFTGGAGNDTFDLSATDAMVTITDFSSDDAIIFDGASIYLAPTKVDVSATGTLDAALAAASSNATAGQINWFQYGGATYLVENANGAAGIQSGDTVVKLSGAVDLSGMSIAPSHVLSNKTTEVVLSSDVSAQVAGAALTTVTLSGQGRAGTARTIALANSTANHADTIALNGTGYSSNGTIASTVFVDPVATQAAITTTQRSSLDLTQSTLLTSLTLSGAGALRLATPGSTTSIDGSAATGDLTIDASMVAMNASTQLTVVGGAGHDSLILKDTATASNSGFHLPSGLSMTNIETLNVTTSGNFGSSGSYFDLSSINVPPAFVGEANGGYRSIVAAGSATDVTLTVHGSAGALVLGGKAVAVTADDGFIAISGAALTTVSAMTRGAVVINVVINNADAAGNIGGGTSLTEVSINCERSASVQGAMVTSFTLSGQGYGGFAGAVTVLNLTANHADTITLAGTGYSWNGALVSTIFSDPVATQAAITTTQRSSLDLTPSTQLKGLTLAGAGDLRLATPGSVTSIDGSAATGALTITMGGPATVTTGAGNDTIIAGSGGGTLTGGAGNDAFNVSATGANDVGVVKATITDFSVGDQILFGRVAASFVSTKVDVSGAGGLDAALAAASNNSTKGQITWFQYDGATYLVDNVDGAPGIQNGDIVVKLLGTSNGMLNLSSAWFDGSHHALHAA